jgi:simple sugar transport system permease protein
MSVEAATERRVDERLRKQSLLRRLLNRPELGALAGAIIVWAFFAIRAGDQGFLSHFGTASYLAIAAELGILAIAVSLLMIAGEFDLSIGSMLGAAGITIALISGEYGYNLWIGIGAAMLMALAIGFVNGIIVVKTGLPSFIVTLATLFILRGVTIGGTRKATGRTQISIDPETTEGFDSANTVFASNIRGYPVEIIWWVGFALIATWLLLRTRYGNWIFGAGGNAEAARNVGVPVARVKISLFMLTALAACMVAILQVVAFTGADVLRGGTKEFEAIIAAVIGGTLLTGGYGSAIGACLGAVIFGMVQQGLVFMGVDSDWYNAFVGAMLIIAVLVNRYIRRLATQERE